MKKNYFKIMLVVGLALLFAAFLYRNLAEIETTINVTTSSLTSWIIAAFVVVAASFFFTVKADQKSFSMVRVVASFKRMLKLNLSALATNTLLPSVGVAGAMVYVEDSKDNGYASGAAVGGHILYIISEYSAITIMLLLSLLYLKVMGRGMYSSTIPVAIFLTITLGFYWLMYLSSANSSLAKKILSKIMAPILVFLSIFSKKKAEPEKSVESFFKELSFAAETIKKKPKHLMIAISWSLLNHIAKLSALYFLFISFGYNILASTVVAGYIIGTVVMIVSPTPNGIGFVEGSMVLVFTGLGVPKEIATTVTLIFRGFVFWIPFFIGLLLLQKTRIEKIRKDMVEINEG